MLDTRHRRRVRVAGGARDTVLFPEPQHDPSRDGALCGVAGFGRNGGPTVRRSVVIGLCGSASPAPFRGATGRDPGTAGLQSGIAAVS